MTDREAAIQSAWMKCPAGTSKADVARIIDDYEAARWRPIVEASDERWVLVRHPDKIEVVAKKFGSAWFQQGCSGEFHMSWKPTEFREVFTD